MCGTCLQFQPGGGGGSHHVHLRAAGHGRGIGAVGRWRGAGSDQTGENDH